MKYYDYKKAKNYIEQHKAEIEEASLGMDEDWWWTARTIFEGGKFTVDLDTVNLHIVGINGSYWATPTLEVCFKNGETEKFNCYKGESDDVRPTWLVGGVITESVSAQRSTIERKDI